MTKFKPSGVDWIGDIPNTWEVSRFRYVFRESKEVNGSSPVGEMLSVSGYKGVVPKVYESESLKRDDDQLETYRVVRKGQLAVNTMWLNYAGLGISEFEGHMSPAYRAYWVSKTVHGRYMHHLLRSQIYVNAYTSYLTGVRPNSLQMSRDNLMSFPILLPPIEEQKDIADFLDRELRSIDNLAATQQQLKKLIEERRASLILNGVLGKFLQHDRSSIRDSDWIDSLPSSWQHKRMKYAVAQVKGGVWGQEDDDSEDSIWCVRIADFDRKNLRVNTETQTMRSVTLSERAGRILRRGDLILEKSGGGDQAPVGCVVLYDFDGQAVSSNFTNVLRLRNHQNSRYWTYVNQALYVNGLTWRSIKQTSGIQNLDTENYLNEIVPFPPESDQNVIAEYLDKELAKIDNLQNTIDEFLNLLQERRKALINSAVTGKIDVRGKN